MSRNERAGARIKFFDHQRGYGFILVGSHEASETFFHIADWVENDEPCLHDKVTFVESRSRDGRPCAKSVMRAAV
jgi:cold shock CspA family protein